MISQNMLESQIWRVNSSDCAMNPALRSFIKSCVRRTGYDIVRNTNKSQPVRTSKQSSFDYSLADLSPIELEILNKTIPFTMTNEERIVHLMRAVAYISKNSIPGAFVECGVWRGGSMMAAALALRALGDTERELWLYDTFEGMTQPTTTDVRFDGEPAQKEMEDVMAREGAWCCAGLEDVMANIYSTGYPKEKIHFIKGMVENTIPTTVPESISLLRLDTDWYESTSRELQFLFPLLHVDGVLIVDDYGHWSGSKKAVDEYFAQSPSPVYLHRVDYSARMLVGYGSKKSRG
jgi:O-methyltransferase